MSSPSPVKTTRYPGAIGILPAISLTLFIASPSGNPSRFAEMTTSRVSACRLISDGVSLSEYRATSPSGTRATPSGPRFTASRTPSTWDGSRRIATGSRTRTFTASPSGSS